MSELTFLSQNRRRVSIENHVHPVKKIAVEGNTMTPKELCTPFISTLTFIFLQKNKHELSSKTSRHQHLRF